MKKINFILGIFLLTFSVLQLGAALGGDFFVAPGGSGDGSSWDSPLGGIQEALNIGGVGDDIHVMEGTYTEEVVMVQGVDLYGGYSSALTGTDISSRDPAIYVTTISAEGVSTSGPVVTGADDATIDGFTLTGGQVDVDGGGMFNYLSSPTVANCVFSGNAAVGCGGGMYNRFCLPTIINCTFSGNTAAWGGGMFNWHSAPTVINCTFSGNTAAWGGGMFNFLSWPTITNCILWGDTQEEIYNDSSSSIVTYCDVEGSSVGEGNIDADPLFVDAENGDFHLLPGSPCIDAGRAEGGPGIDFEGDPRPQNCVYDIGADEFSVTTMDSDGDSFFDQDDNCPCTLNLDQSDIDGDEVGDICDNCPTILNPDQADTDEDAIGNVCDAELYVDKVVLKDLDGGVVTEDFSPGTNIRYRVRFTVDGDPNKLYQVVITGKAFSLYKPDGTNPEWKDKFDNPTRKRRKLYGSESKAGYWDKQIPVDATPDKRAKVRFTLRLKGYDEVTETWNLLGIYYANKKFNIVP